jgi:hypothetical protein
MNRWQNYKQLELLPDSAPAPKSRKLNIAYPLVASWRSLLNALAREQVYEQRTDYLERCWSISYSEPYTDRSPSLRKLWNLMD